MSKKLIRRRDRPRVWSNRIFPKVLLNKGRRMFYLITLYVHVARRRDIHIDLLRELNNEFRIAKNVKSLYIPVMAYRMVWQGRRFQFRAERADLNATELECIAERAMRVLPEWSRYHVDDRVVRSETIALLKRCFEERSISVPVRIAAH